MIDKKNEINNIEWIIKEENNKIHKKSRSKSRKYIFQFLYSCSFWNKSREDFEKAFFKEHYLELIDFDFCNEIISWIELQENKIISIISKYAPKFEIEKMRIETLLPLYISIFETFFLKEEVPYKVVINEAVELWKTYWDLSTAKFVNWVLNSIIKDYDNIKSSLETIKSEKKNIIFK